MSYTIWKQVVKGDTIQFPKGYEIISAKEQDGEIAIWALCNKKDGIKERVTIGVFETGEILPKDIKENYEFIDTVILQDVGLVFHVYKKLVRG